MHITIAAIGKESRSSPTSQLFEEYTKRLPWKLSLSEFEIKHNLPEAKRTNKEADLLLNSITPDTKVIVLDERGKNLSSQDLAQQIQWWQDDGIRRMACLIGGAAGHNDAVRKRADLLLSFGKLTWPHKMIRPMLAEQLYRAHTIITGHPYHRE